MFIVIYIFIKFLSHRVEMKFVHFVKTRQNRLDKERNKKTSTAKFM